MNFDKELTQLINEHREKNELHNTHQDENTFYNLIASGDIEQVTPLAIGPKDIHLYESEGHGRLSKDSLRNLKYHMIISVAMITRHCVEKGLEQELAYTLSDLYINRMDCLNSHEEILKLHGDMLMDFTRRMAALPKKKVYSLRVIEAMDYIVRHLNKELNSEIVAKEIGINRSYLSRLFIKERGESISDYIRSEKIRAAANLVRYSDYSYSVIAEYLHFSSQSHFISCFKRKMGCTPAEYRKKNANSNSVY